MTTAAPPPGPGPASSSTSGPTRPSVFVTLCATWLGSGLIPFAPGTWGSLAALPFAWGLAWAGGPVALAAGAVVVFVLGLWASNAYMAATGVHDPGLIVIDEVAGQWIALLPAALDPISYAFGFALFRFFDIVKPWPIRWLDRKVEGGFGVMIDDVLAGVYAAVLVFAWQTWGPA